MCIFRGLDVWKCRCLANPLTHHSSSVFCPLSSALCLLTSVLCPLTSVLCPLSSVFCPLSSVLCLLSSVLWPLTSVSKRFFTHWFSSLRRSDFHRWLLPGEVNLLEFDNRPSKADPTDPLYLTCRKMLIAFFIIFVGVCLPWILIDGIATRRLPTQHMLV